MSGFADRIRQARINKNWNQEELAKEVSLTQGAISQFEKGQRMPTPINLQLLAQKLEVSVDYLLGEEDNAEHERVKLMRTIQSLSPEALKKVQGLVDWVKDVDVGKKV